MSFGFLTLCLALFATLAQAIKFDLAPSKQPRECPKACIAIV